MEYEIAILCLVLFCAAYKIGRVGYEIEKKNREKSDYDRMNDSINDAINEEDKLTRNLVIKTLKGIGCQPEIGDDNRFIFKYQGEDFMISASNDTYLIWIYDYAWMGLEVNDTNVDYLKQAINKVNEYSAIKNIYTINEVEGYIVADCQIAIYFACIIPDCCKYLQSILDGFFITHQCVKDEFTKLAKIQGQGVRTEITDFCSN